MSVRHKQEPNYNLTKTEFDHILTGDEIIRLTGCITAKRLDDWEIFGHITPIDLKPGSLHIGSRIYDTGYSFGEIINTLRQENTNEDIIKNIILNFRSIYTQEHMTGDSDSSTTSATYLNNSVNNKEKTSYLKVIAALCSSQGKIDIYSREATGQIKMALQKIGLDLSDDTIKKIKDEVQQVIDR